MRGAKGRDGVCVEQRGERQGNRSGAEGREGIVEEQRRKEMGEEQREERGQVRSRGSEGTASSRGNGTIGAEIREIGEEQREEREYCLKAVEGTEGIGEEQRKEGLVKSRGKRGICEVLK
jgi:hypothetical protein